MAFLLFFTAVILSGIAAYYSVIGLLAIFSAAVVPVAIMGGSLEAAKLVVASWLYRYWNAIPFLMKTYFTFALVILMLITSMGIFGFLSKAHSDQSLVSGDVQAKIAVYDEKIKTAKENIEASRKQLKQMDEAVDQVMGRSTDEKGADKAVSIRKAQSRDRSALAKDIEANQKLIATLNDQAAPIRAEVRKVEAEVGPIKYIAAMLYGDNPDENMLERSVRWLIILLICVFDPLAVLMLIAANLTQMKQAEWKSGKKDSSKESEEILPPAVAEQGNDNDNKSKDTPNKTILPVVVEEPVRAQGDDQPIAEPINDSGTKVEEVGQPLNIYTEQQPPAKRIEIIAPQEVVEQEVTETKKKVKETDTVDKPAVVTTEVVEQKKKLNQ
jgi:hypothetical protein